MNYDELLALCLEYPGAYEDHPFDANPGGEGWTLVRHEGNRKTFAFLFFRDGLCVNLKCEPMRSDFLRSALAPGVTPAYHMNKEHWITVRADHVERSLLEQLIGESYDLIRPKARRK